eukprot:gene22421-biopygen16246
MQETGGFRLPRRDPAHAARAPGAQMIRMPADRSLAFQRMSRDTPNFILSVRLAETVEVRQYRMLSVAESSCPSLSPWSHARRVEPGLALIDSADHVRADDRGRVNHTASSDPTRRGVE